jgi:hypothetical protein
MADRLVNYTPPKTVETFMLSEAFFRLIYGPVGSGKTTGIIFELLRRACEQLPAPDGKRYTRFAIVRQTLQQIKLTILKDVLQWIPMLADWRVSESTIYIRIGDVVSEWILIPLENPEDQRRLLSMNITGAWISEAIEIDADLISAIEGRIGRYPSADMGGATWIGIVADTNAPTDGSPWADLITNPPPDWEVFRQPGGLDPDAENLNFLLQTAETLKLPIGDPKRIAQGRTYYERLSRNRNTSWVTRYVHALLGPDPSGAAVFAGAFRQSFHVVASLEPVKGKPLIIGQDFGRDPWGVVLQEDHRGRILVLEEIEAEDTGLINHCRVTLRPRMQQSRYLGMSMVIVGDPAGNQRSDYDEKTAFDILKHEGFTAIPAMTNDIDTRLTAVESYLLQQRDGMGAILFDRSRCPKLISAMNGMYRYSKTNLDVSRPKPDKNPWSHVADALQYGVLAMGGTRTAMQIAKKLRGRAPARQRVSSGGWT